VTGSGFTRFTNNWASKNFKLVFEPASLLIMYNEVRAFVNLICRLTPGKKDERDVEQNDVHTPENLKFFTGAKFVPTSDETSVSHGSYRRGRGIAWQHVASVAIPVGVREMCGCRIGAVAQESLEIRAIFIALARLRNYGSIENDVTLTEE